MGNPRLGRYKSDEVVGLGALPPRQRELAQYMAAGFPTSEIAGHMGLSLNTLRNMRAEIYRRLGLQGLGNPRIRLARLGWSLPAIAEDDDV